MQDLLSAQWGMKKNLRERFPPRFSIDFVLKQHTLHVGEGERFANVERRLGKNRVLRGGRFYTLGYELEYGRRNVGASAGFLGQVGGHEPGRLPFHDRHPGSGAVI